MSQSNISKDVLKKRLLIFSPNNSLARPYSPKSSSNLAGNYNRPQPPPYMGSATNTLHHRKSTIDTPSTSGHTPEHRTLALEESLKLLNDANITTDFDIPILKEPILDVTDGTEDYVPIKPDSSGYISMKAELDDIDVPDLAKFGVAIWHEATADGQPPVKTWFC